MQRGLSAELTGGLYSPENDNPSVTALRAVPPPFTQGRLEYGGGNLYGKQISGYVSAGAGVAQGGNADHRHRDRIFHAAAVPAQSGGAAGVRAGVLPARLRAVLRRHRERAAQGGPFQAGHGHALPQRRQLHALADPRARRRRIDVRHRPLRYAGHRAHGGHYSGHGAGTARFSRRSGRALRLFAARVLRQGVAGQGAAFLLARRAGAASARRGARGRVSRAARS